MSLTCEECLKGVISMICEKHWGIFPIFTPHCVSFHLIFHVFFSYPSSTMTSIMRAIQSVACKFSHISIQHLLAFKITNSREKKRISHSNHARDWFPNNRPRFDAIYQSARYTQYSPTGTYFADALVVLCGGRFFRLFVVGRLWLFAWTFGIGACCDPFSDDVIAFIQCVYCSINNIGRFVCVVLFIYRRIQSTLSTQR